MRKKCHKEKEKLPWILCKMLGRASQKKWNLHWGLSNVTRSHLPAGENLNKDMEACGYKRRVSGETTKTTWWIHICKIIVHFAKEFGIHSICNEEVSKNLNCEIEKTKSVFRKNTLVAQKETIWNEGKVEAGDHGIPSSCHLPHFCQCYYLSIYLLYTKYISNFELLCYIYFFFKKFFIRYIYI